MSVHEVETILGLLVAVAAIVAVSRRTTIPYPILLVVGGLALALIPGLPVVRLQPDLILLLFLPPLLFRQATTASFRDFRANRLPILSLAFGLVLATAATVALVAHSLIPGLPWSAAFVLGAVLAPTDEVAVTEMGKRLPIPDRVLTILEGESLINDASALVIYRMAIAATASGVFSFSNASLQFLGVGLGGATVGLLVGVFIAGLQRRLWEDPPVENTISLLTPFTAYLPAESLGVSGVLAVVTAGLYLGRQGPRLVSSRTRQQGQGFWQMILFLLNGLLFILTGLQLRLIRSESFVQFDFAVLGDILAILIVILGLRFAWVFLYTYLPRARIPGRRRRSPSFPWQHTVLIALGGIRGGISLVAALAIPLTLAGGKPFPERNLLIAISFFVILGTLLLQGLLLPWLIPRLGAEKETKREQEEITARLAAVQAALAYLNMPRMLESQGTLENEEELQTEDSSATVSPALVAGLRDYYERRAQHLKSRLPEQEAESDAATLQAYKDLLRELVQVKREAVLRLLYADVISDPVMRRVQQDLDLEELRLGPPRDG